MNTQIRKDLLILKEDYDLLMEYAKSRKDLMKMEKINAGWLLESLEEAVVLENEEFPEDVVRLNSKVTLREKDSRFSYTYTVVLPHQADHRRGKVSVLAPIGASMFGYRKGEEVYWQGAEGRRMFTIKSVHQLKG